MPTTMIYFLMFFRLYGMSRECRQEAIRPCRMCEWYWQKGSCDDYRRPSQEAEGKRVANSR
jgi:hypothetical protein